MDALARASGLYWGERRIGGARVSARLHLPGSARGVNKHERFGQKL